MESDMNRYDLVFVGHVTKITVQGVLILKNHNSKRRKLWTKTGCSMQRECLDEDSS